MEQIDQMLQQFKDIVELQAFSKAQFNIINKLNAELNIVKQKNEELERLLSDQNPVPPPKELENAEDAEVICRTQLHILKNKALTTELTKEEASRCQIYYDILEKIVVKKDKEPKDVTPLEEKELLKLVENNDAGNS